MLARGRLESVGLYSSKTRSADVPVAPTIALSSGARRTGQGRGAASGASEAFDAAEHSRIIDVGATAFRQRRRALRKGTTACSRAVRTACWTPVTRAARAFSTGFVSASLLAASSA